MLKRISVLVLLGILVMACNGFNRPKKPKNLISKNQMSELLYDLYIISAAKGVNRKTLEINGFNPETYILDKYKIDSTQFADSNTYYAFDPEVYKAIVDKAKARLEKEKKEFESLKERESDSIQKRKDSIRGLGNKGNSLIKKLADSTTGFKLQTPKGLLEIED